MLDRLSDFLPDNLAQQIFEVLPKNVRSAKDDIQQELKEILSVTFAKLDLVTREEFDIQTKVLQATRARVEALEKQIKAMHNTP